jgi:hypothetical protein
MKHWEVGSPTDTRWIGWLQKQTFSDWEFTSYRRQTVCTFDLPLAIDSKINIWKKYSLTWIIFYKRNFINSQLQLIYNLENSTKINRGNFNSPKK